MKSSIVKSLAIMIPVFFIAGCSSKESAAPAPQVNKVKPAAAKPAPPPPQPKVQIEGSKDGFKLRIEN